MAPTAGESRKGESTMVVLDAATLNARLERAGFERVESDHQPGVRITFLGHRPA